MITSIMQALFKKSKFNQKSEHKKKWQRIYDLLNAETKPRFSLSTLYKVKKLLYRKRAF